MENGKWCKMGCSKNVWAWCPVHLFFCDYLEKSEIFKDRLKDLKSEIHTMSQKQAKNGAVVSLAPSPWATGSQPKRRGTWRKVRANIHCLPCRSWTVASSNCSAWNPPNFSPYSEPSIHSFSVSAFFLCFKSSSWLPCKLSEVAVKSNVFYLVPEVGARPQIETTYLQIFPGLSAPTTCFWEAASPAKWQSLRPQVLRTRKTLTIS